MLILDVLSSFPGRIRFRCQKLLMDKALARFTEVYVGHLYGVKKCSANQYTAAILVDFDKRKTASGVIGQNIEKAMGSALKNRNLMLSEYEQYYKLLDERDRAKREFLIFGLIYILLKIKHASYGKFSLSSNVRVLQLAAAVTIIGGYPLIKAACKKITGRLPADPDVLLSLTALSFTLMRESSKGVFVLLLKALNDYVKLAADAENSRLLAQNTSTSAGMAWLIEEEGEEKLVPAGTLKKEDRIAIHAGELVPAEGIILDGNAVVNTLYFTGQPAVNRLEAGNAVFEGFSILSGRLAVSVKKSPANWNKTAGEKTLLSGRVSAYQRKITPVALGAAAAGFLLGGGIMNALSVLLVLSPSAAGTALSTGNKSYITLLNKNGIYLRDPGLIEKISNARHIVFDKTGTLTCGIMKITAITSYNDRYDARRLLEICAACETGNYHPISVTLRDYAGPFDPGGLESSVYLPSLGIMAEYSGHEVVIGNNHLMQQRNIDTSKGDTDYESYMKMLYTPVFVAIDGQLAGMLVMKDYARSGADRLIEKLKRQGVEISLVTGDECKKAEAFANELGIKNVYGNCSDIDKQEIVKDLKKHGTVIMVGDGVNDAPAMQEADIAVSYADSACDMIMLHADCTVFDDDLARLSDLLYLSSKSYKMVKQNLDISALYNAAFGGMALLSRFDAFAAKSFNTVNSMLVLLLNKRIEYISSKRQHGFSRRL